MARPVVGGTVRDTASTYDRVEDVYRSVSRRMWQALFAYSGDPGTANLFVVDNRLMQWSTDEQPTADEGAG